MASVLSDLLHMIFKQSVVHYKSNLKIVVFVQWSSGYLHYTVQCKNLVNHLRITHHENLKIYHVFWTI